MRSAAPTCAPWFRPTALGWAAIAAVIAAVVAGCTASAEDVRPPQDQLYFPTGIAVSVDKQALFIANANSDQRYDSGSIGVIDLMTVSRVIEAWITQTKADEVPGCAQDSDHRETLVCDEAPFLKPEAAVRIGNFATQLAVQDFTGGPARVFVPTRGDPSVAWADYADGRLQCTDDTASYALCDDAHRLTSLGSDASIALPSEPFGVFADPTQGFAIVTHILTSAVTLIRAPADSGQVAIVDIRNQQFGALASGVSSATGIAGRTTATGEVVYIGSGTDSQGRIQTYRVGQRDGATSYLVPGSFFFLNAVGSSAGGSTETQGLTFSPDGNRLYLVNRFPPTIQIYDTSLGPTGVALNQPLGASDICRQATMISVLGTGDAQRAYITCFQDGQVYVIDPRGSSQVEDIISVGRGPYGIAAVTAGTRPLLFVSNFFEDTVAVIDLGLDAKHNHVVLRIGIPRAQ